MSNVLRPEPQSPESQQEAVEMLQQVNTGIQGVTDESRESVTSILDNANFQQFAADTFAAMKAKFNEADAGQLDQLRLEYFPKLAEYFASREFDLRGPSTFTVHDFHFLDSKHSGAFHDEFFQYLAEKEPGDNPAETSLLYRSAEFSANALRRNVVTQKGEDIVISNKDALETARAANETLLRLWSELTEDEKLSYQANSSSGRLHTELAFIARVSGDSLLSAEHYEQASEFAAAIGDDHQEVFNGFESIRLRQADAVDESDHDQIIQQVSTLQPRTLELWKSNRDQKSANSAMNGYLFLAEAQFAAGKTQEAIGSLMSLSASLELLEDLGAEKEEALASTQARLEKYQQ